MTSAVSKTMNPPYGNGSGVTAAAMPKKHLRNEPAGLNLTLETIVRIVLTSIYIGLEFQAPFMRKVQPEELWMYRNPRTNSYVPLTMLWPVVLGVPGFIFLLYYLQSRDRQDLRCTVLAFTLGLGLNGVLTSTLKIAVGRPRPDFFWRCFPDGVTNEELHCTGTDQWALADGRKSFPSGHSSFAFVGLGFLTWYLIGKLHLLNERGRGRSVRMIAAGLPSFVALLIAISRTCDYHHHWQDVTVGSLIGAALSYLCYRQYYPGFSERNCHLPYGRQQTEPNSPSHSSTNRTIGLKRPAQQSMAGAASPPSDGPSGYKTLRSTNGAGDEGSDSETGHLLSPTPDQKEAKWI
ncbi:phospholipid phosphatase 5 [Anopheles cruzii]|uniref:phospholipid phosphatase 5 n=1 Tax=Anopheles cruzii TaxID=68878 RepID=UPI0022EC75AA|nr:phospholipid phosphatase 5 [Anopheles cruzii]